MSAVWELIGIDLTGPLPKTVDGFQYILTATDYFSKWVEAFPLKSKSAAEVGRNICSIIYRHGCPKRILSDQGREFVNELCAYFKYYCCIVICPLFFFVFNFTVTVLCFSSTAASVICCRLKEVPQLPITPKPMAWTRKQMTT